MKKHLLVSQALKSFTGEPLKEDDGKDMTLKSVLLEYLGESSRMGLLPSEKGVAYALGMLIGTSEKEVSLSPEQYDLLKKICDNPVVKVQTEKGEIGVPFRFKIVVTQQVKELVDGAETVKEEKKA